MKSLATALFLGTGASMGIPVIGCDCPVCTSQDSANNRFRPSLLLTVGEKKILVDCGPDFHAQALKYRIHRLDGVILTHAHNDHTAGLDELRIYHMQSQEPIPCLLSQATYVDIKQRFAYIFEREAAYDKLTAKLDIQLFPAERGEVTFLGIPITYFTYEQAGMPVNGFRIGNMAYVTDIRKYPETIFQDLKGIEILVLSALRYTPSTLHFSVDEAVAFAECVGAKQTWLTHIAHDLDHARTNAYLRENIQLAYDGLQFIFEE